MHPGKFVWKPFLKKALTGYFCSFHMVAAGIKRLIT